MRVPINARVGLTVMVLCTVATASLIAAESPELRRSNRLIVELENPPLVRAQQQSESREATAPLDFTSAAALAHRQQILDEQDGFIERARSRFPQLTVSAFVDETGQRREARTALLLNTVTVDFGESDPARAADELRRLPGVRAVYLDHAYQPTLYSSLPLIDAPAMWNHRAIGGVVHAGEGVKIASVDGGLHRDAPMFDGTGYGYPPGFPRGDTANTNGKIIASRAYFRATDPPVTGDGNTWPVQGTSHGVHTGSIAGGNQVPVDYLGFPTTVSGVAPAAWMMSYRIFYSSQSGDGSAYATEILAALEDVVADGADVVNNSWGDGPRSVGGIFDAVDTALTNAALAGIVVVMSNGDAGPATGTGDHPSPAYINVAATTTGSSLGFGRLDVSAPTPVPVDLTDLEYRAANFGGSLALGMVTEWDFIAAASADAANAEGCNPFADPGLLAGKAVLILRGTCEFGVKALNAETAGAALVIVYNHATGGDALVAMAAGAVGDQVTIPALFVGNTDGAAMIAFATTKIETDTTAFIVTGTADRVASFSSRGPGAGDTLKPDLAAPGVSILAQGYTPDASGEAVHLGFGQASGASMAAPHVAGAAALLQQIHPGWSNADIKSALMSTAVFLSISNEDGTPAQPLDMGAGRIDLSKAADPGIILDPPSLAFGPAPEGASVTQTFSVHNVTGDAESYFVFSVDTSTGNPVRPPVPGLTVTPTWVTLPPNGSASISLTWDSSAAVGPGDRQGFVVLDGDLGHEAHLPVWMRVVPAAPTADVLLVDNDGSSTLGTADYTPIYTAALDLLGLSYTVIDADISVLGSSDPDTFPSAAELAGYSMVIYQTGDYQNPNGTFTVATAPRSSDLARLTEFLNAGGRLIAFGQDADQVFRQGSFFYAYNLASSLAQDGFTGTPDAIDLQPLTGVAGTAFASLSLDISNSGDGAGNQALVNEVASSAESTDELGEVTPVLEYLGGTPLASGAVALHHRQQPSLERPGISYLGASVAFGFGLEGVNDDTGTNTRAEVLGAAIDLLNDQVTAVIDASLPPYSRDFSFVGTLTSPGSAASYRWDFGDGTPYVTTTSPSVTHTYAAEGDYRVRLEVTNTHGTRGLTSTTVTMPLLPLFSDGFESGDTTLWSVSAP